MSLFYVRVRSKAGVPFEHAQWCLAGVEWTEIGIHSHDLPVLLAHRWIDLGPLPPEAVATPTPARAAESGIALRVRTLRSAEIRTGGQSFGRLVRVLRVPSRLEVEHLRNDTCLDVRDHDPSLYPDTVFVRVRVRAKEQWSSMCPRLFERATKAYELSFDDFSLVRLDPRLEVELLEPAAMPPLERVRVRSRTGKPFMALSTSFLPKQWTEIELYPREIEYLLSTDHLDYEPCPLPPAIVEPPQEAGATLETASPLMATDEASGENPSSLAITEPPPMDTRSPMERIATWAQRPEVLGRGHAQEGFTLDEILDEVLGEEVARVRSRAFEMQLASALRQLGWERTMRRRDGLPVRLYVPGPRPADGNR